MSQEPWPRRRRQGLRLPAGPTLIAELVFLAFIVGPTEEQLFRGLIQTGLHQSMGPWGTVIGALLFGLFHLINLGYQPLGATLQQVLTAIVIASPGAQRGGLFGNGDPLARVFDCTLGRKA